MKAEAEAEVAHLLPVGVALVVVVHPNQVEELEGLEGLDLDGKFKIAIVHF